MADNVTLPGTGSVVATDDVGGVQYQQVKLVDGTLDSSTPVGTNANPLKVTGPDCVSLLSTTITVAGVSSSIDTLGYGAAVVQISGVWQGALTFEASNDGTVWDTVLVFSRENLSLQDIVTSGGLYTIRPSGRYLRINVTNVVGSIGVNAIGRAAEGIAAADLLSLAMDANNNTPLNVAVQGAGGRALAQDQASGALIARLTDRLYSGSGTASGVVLFTAPCDDMNFILLTMVASTTSQIQIEVLLPDGSWQAVFAQFNGVTASTNQAQSIFSSGTNAVWATAHLGGATFVRVRLTAAVATRVIAKLTNVPPPAMLWAATTVSQPTAANLLCTANIATTTTVATTNGQSLSQTIITSTVAAAVQVKNTPGRITMLQISNAAANVGYLHLQNNSAAASNTASVMTFAIPATAGANISIALPEGGLYMSSGIAFTVSGAIASGDTTALTAPSIAVNISYI